VVVGSAVVAVVGSMVGSAVSAVVTAAVGGSGAPVRCSLVMVMASLATIEEICLQRELCKGISAHG
jgi:hypothetical protein